MEVLVVGNSVIAQVYQANPSCLGANIVPIAAS
jgi:hypothetical protein